MRKPFSLLTAVLTAFAALAIAGVTSDWEEYTDNELHVAFRHPRDWKPSRHVQAAGHVRRRQQQREYRTAFSGRRRGDGEEFLFNPVVGPARFDRARLVRFRQFVRHELAVSRQRKPSTQRAQGITG